MSFHGDCYVSSIARRLAGDFVEDMQHYWLCMRRSLTRIRNFDFLPRFRLVRVKVSDGVFLLVFFPLRNEISNSPPWSCNMIMQDNVRFK